MDQKDNKIKYLILTCGTVLLWLILIAAFTGNWPTTGNPYNSYSLQADSWRHGRLDLGENYYHLELAIYNNKYYVSFPPFPSYVMFPFTLIWGSSTPDGIILWISNLILAIFLFKLADHLIDDGLISYIITIFLMLGTNVAFTISTPWVWFWAQNLCLLTSVMSIYYAFKRNGHLSLGLWACSVGCRPMQALFFPVLLVILLYQEKKINPETSYISILISKLLWFISPFIIGLSYMILNYLRFDNPLEFGHNYLPEFTESEYGQFSIHYLENNFKMLMNIPDFNDEHKYIVDHFGNINFILVSPLIIFALISVVSFIIKKNKKQILFSILIIALSSAYLLVTMMHKTMGGWHFGNRYTNDILPYLFLLSLMGIRKNKNTWTYMLPLLIWGLCLNIAGSIIVYNGL